MYIMSKDTNKLFFITVKGKIKTYIDPLQNNTFFSKHGGKKRNKRTMMVLYRTPEYQAAQV